MATSKKAKTTRKAKPVAKTTAVARAKATARPTAGARAKAKPIAKARAKPITKAKASARALGKTVDDYARGLAHAWQRDVVAKLRAIVKKAAPKALESIKWGQPVYEIGGPFAYIKAFASGLNFGFWRGVELPDPRKLLAGAGDRMRHVKITESTWKAVPEDALEALGREAAALNERHGDPTKRT